MCPVPPTPDADAIAEALSFAIELVSLELEKKILTAAVFAARLFIAGAPITVCM
ncbi:hypothetical protein [Haloquadratum walsbyi]|uniref:hypothetical protein n=1 Tax=Haloquadratum walsbyi TaxID=293091 RepID=UPI000A99C70F|nr:hypothetical protein [Haloquadratum walsbyi]